MCFKRVLWVFVFSLFWFGTMAQSFLKYFDADNWSTQAYSLCIRDSFFWVTGSVVDTTTAGAIKSFLAKFDYDGNEISDTTYRPPEFARFDLTLVQNAMINTNDGGMVAVGGAVDTMGKYLILFSKIDSFGKISFYKTIIPTTDSYFVAYGYQVIERDSAYYILGDVETAGYYVEPLLIRLDLEGNLQFVKIYTTLPLPYDNELSMCILPDSNFLITEDRDDNNINPWQADLATSFLEVDTGGNLKRQYNTLDNNTFASNALEMTLDKNYLTCGSYFKYRAEGYSYEFQEYLIKWDTNFNTLWSLFAGDTGYNNNFSAFKQDGHGNIFLCGSNCDDITQTSIVGCLAKVDSGGNLIWYHTYRVPTGFNPDYSTNTLSDIALLPDGSILAIGSWQYGNTSSPYPFGSPQVAWIIKVDSNGCMDDGTCGLTAGIEHPEQMQESPTQSIRLFPNPSNGVVTITSVTQLPAVSMVEIYDEMGRKIYTQAIFNRSNLLNLYYLASGIYFYKVSSGLLNVGQGKLVILK